MTLPASAAPMLERLPGVLTGLRPELEGVERRLRSAEGVRQAALQQLLDWVFASGGKRIRPAIVLACARLGKADPDAITNLAAGLETLHAATLVHDDLVDGALSRRGMPTLNTRWSAGGTVLAGDWLFARAARFVADTENIAVVKIFARTLGTITDGELRQLFGRSGMPTLEQYEYRIYAKTASLFEAAAESAGHLLGAPPEGIEALAQYGRETGVAFQIADDILDFTGDPAVLGKPVGSDLRSGQVTLPALLHLTERSDTVPWLAGGEAEPGPGEVEALIQAVREDRAALSAARAVAMQHRRAAITALDALPDGPARDDLARIAEYVVGRDA